MPNTSTLVKILKDSELKKVFEKILQKRGLWRLYELATIHRDEMTVREIYFENYSAKELNFAPTIYKTAKVIYNKLLLIEDKKMLAKVKKDEGRARNLTSEDMDQVTINVRESVGWKKFFKSVKVVLNQKLNELAERELRHTPEYAEYVRKKAKKEAERLAKEHEMDREMDDWLGLSVAVATGDDQSAARLSQSLSTKHKPKNGKAKKASEMLKAAKTKVAKVFHL